MTKICSKCGEEKPATTEYFGKMKSSKDGLRGHRRNNKDFDSYRYVAFGNYEETKEEERRLIKLLEPKYNKQCVPGKIKYPGLRSYKG